MKRYFLDIENIPITYLLSPFLLCTYVFSMWLYSKEIFSSVEGLIYLIVGCSVVLYFVDKYMCF